MTLTSENDGKGETIHQLAARKAVIEIEEGRSWLYETVDANGTKLKEKMEGRWGDMVECEAVRLGIEFQVGGKWCSFVALEDNNKPEAKAAAADGSAMEQDWEYLDDMTEPSNGTHLFKYQAMAQIAGLKADCRYVTPHPTASANTSSVLPESHNLAGYQTTLMHLEQANPNRLRMAPAGGRGGGQAPRFRRGTVGTRSGTRGGGGTKFGKEPPLAEKRALALPQMQQMAQQTTYAAPVNVAPPPPGMPMPGAAAAGNALFSLDEPVLMHMDAPSQAGAALPPPPLGNMSMASWGGPPGGAPVTASLLPKKRKAKHGGAPSSAAAPAALPEAAVPGGAAPGQTPLQRLVALQGFEGCWEWSSELLHTVGVTAEGAEKEGLGEGRVAATVLAVAFLRLRLGEEEEAWELVVEKAEEWVRANAGGEAEAEALRERAERLVGGM